MKMPKSRFSKPGKRIMPLLAILFTTSLAQAPRPEPVTDQETELGQQVYKELLAKGEIIDSSPLYESLKPVADAISRVAQPRYPTLSNSFLSTKPIPMPSRRQAGTFMWWTLFCTL